ncbi:TetR/AcrR family transcriptional regulator [Pseudonocardia sp. CA-107938]|uniref:TetR/AcrR family transcriptional regulator n=1 Tax=Pseudonocardia sp. CA-107938 TaxID=3240021 RepID=UPI003D8E3D3F
MSTSPRGAGAQAQNPPRRRADAERNITAILDAAAACLSRRSQVSMAEVATAAGVGRVTLYAHFSSREVLLEAVLDRAIAQAAAVIEQTRPDDGPADVALQRLVRSSWEVLDRHRGLFEATQREFGAARLRQRHDPAFSRIEALLARGRSEGTIRTDLPLSWLVTAVYALMHAAADDVNTNRLPQRDAGRVLEATVLSAVAMRGEPPTG